MQVRNNGLNEFYLNAMRDWQEIENRQQVVNNINLPFLPYDDMHPEKIRSVEPDENLSALYCRYWQAAEKALEYGDYEGLEICLGPALYRERSFYAQQFYKLYREWERYQFETHFLRPSRDLAAWFVRREFYSGFLSDYEKKIIQPLNEEIKELTQQINYLENTPRRAELEKKRAEKQQIVGKYEFALIEHQDALTFLTIEGYANFMKTRAMNLIAFVDSLIKAPKEQHGGFRDAGRYVSREKSNELKKLLMRQLDRLKAEIIQECTDVAVSTKPGDDTLNTSRVAYQAASRAPYMDSKYCHALINRVIPVWHEDKDSLLVDLAGAYKVIEDALIASEAKANACYLGIRDEFVAYQQVALSTANKEAKILVEYRQKATTWIDAVMTFVPMTTSQDKVVKRQLKIIDILPGETTEEKVNNIIENRMGEFSLSQDGVYTHPDNSNTLLHSAILKYKNEPENKKDMLDIIELLVERGASFTAVNKENRNCLQHAEIIELDYKLLGIQLATNERKTEIGELCREAMYLYWKELDAEMDSCWIHKDIKIERMHDLNEMASIESDRELIDCIKQRSKDASLGLLQYSRLWDKLNNIVAQAESGKLICFGANSKAEMAKKIQARKEFSVYINNQSFRRIKSTDLGSQAEEQTRSYRHGNN